MLLRRVSGFSGRVFPFLTVSLMPDLGVFQLLQDTRLSAVSIVSLRSGCLFPRLCQASVHGAWLAREQGGFSPWVARAGHAPFSRSRRVSTGRLLVVDWLSGDGGILGNDGFDLMFLFFRFCLLLFFFFLFFSFLHSLPL